MVRTSCLSFLGMFELSLLCSLAVRMKLDVPLQPMNPERVMPKEFGAPDAPNEILALGDSLTAGWCNNGNGAFHPYGRYLQQTLGKRFRVIVNGISGTAAGAHWKRFPNAGDATHDPIVASGQGPGVKTIIGSHPNAKLAIIMLGTNDMGMGGATDAIVQNVLWVHKTCHSLKIPTLMVTVPEPLNFQHPVFAKRRDVNADLAAWCALKPMCLAVISGSSLLRIPDPAESMRPTKLHYAPEAYMNMGVQLADSVRLCSQVEVQADAHQLDLTPLFAGGLRVRISGEDGDHSYMCCCLAEGRGFKHSEQCVVHPETRGTGVGEQPKCSRVYHGSHERYFKFDLTIPGRENVSFGGRGNRCIVKVDPDHTSKPREQAAIVLEKHYKIQQAALDQARDVGNEMLHAKVRTHPSDAEMAQVREAMQARRQMKAKIYFIRHGFSRFNLALEKHDPKAASELLSEKMYDAPLEWIGREQAVASQEYFKRELAEVPVQQVQLAGSLLGRAYDTLLLATSHVWSQWDADVPWLVHQLPAVMEFGGGRDVTRKAPRSVDLAEQGSSSKQWDFRPVNLADSSLGSKVGSSPRPVAVSQLLDPGYGQFYANGPEPSVQDARLGSWVTQQRWQVLMDYPRRTTSAQEKTECGDPQAELQFASVLKYLTDQVLEGKTHIVVGSHSGFIRCLFKYMGRQGIGDARGMQVPLGSGFDPDKWLDKGKPKVPNGGVVSFDLSFTSTTEGNGASELHMTNIGMNSPGFGLPVLGYISLTVHRANALADLDLAPGDHSDPFCRVQFNGQTWKTMVIDNDLNPEWGATFVMAYSSPRQVLRLQVFDKDYMRNQLIGEVDLIPFEGDIIPPVPPAHRKQDLHVELNAVKTYNLENSAREGPLGSITISMKYTPVDHAGSGEAITEFRRMSSLGADSVFDGLHEKESD